MRRIWFLPGLTFCAFFLLTALFTALAGAPLYGFLFALASLAFGLLAWWATPSDARHHSTTDRYPVVTVEP
jgi:hypothetical protein